MWRWAGSRPTSCLICQGALDDLGWAPHSPTQHLRQTNTCYTFLTMRLIVGMSYAQRRCPCMGRKTLKRPLRGAGLMTWARWQCSKTLYARGSARGDLVCARGHRRAQAPSMCCVCRSGVVFAVVISSSAQHALVGPLRLSCGVVFDRSMVAHARSVWWTLSSLADSLRDIGCRSFVPAASWPSFVFESPGLLSRTSV